MKAKPIATKGGNNVKIPKRIALSSLAGAWEINKDKTKRAIIDTAAIKPNFILSLIFIYYTIFPIHFL